MANKNDNKAAAKAAETKEVKNPVTESNIEEQIKSANKMEDDIVKAAEEALQKEKDDKKKQEMKEAIVMAEYINKRELLELRKRREEEKATKTALSATLETLEKLKKGEITPREMDIEMGKIAEDKAKAFNEIDNHHRELLKELQANFPGYYSVEWEYERWSNGGRRRRWDW